MAKATQELELDRALERLFDADEAMPCPIGTEPFREFAAARPVDLTFLQPQDFIDLTSSAFTGIVEWDAFAGHYATCERCNA